MDGFPIGGKTGTAETNKRIDGRRIKDTWFVSFAPVDDPRYAVVVLVVGGRSGGDSCAPVARRIYQFLKDLQWSGDPAPPSFFESSAAGRRDRSFDSLCFVQ